MDLFPARSHKAQFHSWQVEFCSLLPQCGNFLSISCFGDLISFSRHLEKQGIFYRGAWGSLEWRTSAKGTSAGPMWIYPSWPQTLPDIGKKGIPVLWQLCQNVSCPFLTRSWYFSLCRAFPINIFATTEITQITSLSTPYGVSFRRGFAAKIERQKDGKFSMFWSFHKISLHPENRSQSFQSQLPSLPQQFWFLSRKRRFQLTDILRKQHLIKTKDVWVFSSKLTSDVALAQPWNILN